MPDTVKWKISGDLYGRLRPITIPDRYKWVDIIGGAQATRNDGRTYTLNWSVRNDKVELVIVLHEATVGFCGMKMICNTPPFAVSELPNMVETMLKWS